MLRFVHTRTRALRRRAERLEGVIAAGDRTVVYPQLAGRRQRIGELENELIAFRNDIASQLVAQVAASGALAQATSQRKALAAQFASTPVPEVAQSTSTAAARERTGQTEAQRRQAFEVQKTRAVLADLSLNGKPFREILKERVK